MTPRPHSSVRREPRAGAGDALWIIAAVVSAVRLAVGIVRDLLAGHTGVDIVAFLAMVGSVALGEYLAGAVIAAMAGHFGTPVIMLSGDQAAADELREIVPAAELAVVKEGFGRYSCISLSAPAARERFIFQPVDLHFARGTKPGLERGKPVFVLPIKGGDA